MSILKVDKLERSVIFFIATGMLFLIITSIGITKVLDHKNQNRMQKEFTQQLHSSIEHVINHHENDNLYRLRRLVTTSKLIEMIKKGQREKIYKLLKPKWELFRLENPNIEVLNIYRPDGSVFLRMHDPESYNDNLTKLRPMIAAMNINKKPLSGYETGKYARVYRYMYPMFDKENHYIGIAEIGISPKFIIDEVEEINQFCGLFFIKDDALSLHIKNETKNKLLIDGYRLQTKLNPKLDVICDSLVKKKIFDDEVRIQTEDKEYLTHLFILKDFKGAHRVKIVFFQDITEISPFQNKLLFGLISLMFLAFILIVWLVQKRMRSYSLEISDIYNAQNDALRFNQRYLESVFNVSPNIMFTTNGEQIDRVNLRMLEYFGYENIENFNKEHACVCEFFLEEEGCLHANMENLSWLEYVIQHPLQLHKVCMEKEGEKSRYIVHVETLSFDGTHRSIVVLSDVTELEKVRERYEYAINGTQDGLWDWNITTNEIYFSENFKKMLGYEDGEFENSVQSWEDKVDPEQMEEVQKLILEAQNDPSIEYESTFRMRHKEGHWIWILARGQTIFNSENQAIRMIGFHIEITKIKELEESIRKSETKFQAFMNNIPGQVFIKDENSVINYVNEEAKSWYPDAIGKEVDVLFDAEMSKYIHEKDIETLDKGFSEEIEQIIDPDAKSLYFRVISFVMEGEAQRPLIGVIAFDITESYGLQKKLKEQEQLLISQSRHAAMGEMIGMIAHQWRQPLGVITMGANNILADIALETFNEMATTEQMEIILKQAEHLSATIDDFRNFFRPEKEKERVYLDEIMKEALQVIDGALLNNNIALSYSCSSKSKVNIFSRELLHVFINILKNAKEAFEDVSKDKKEIVITIYDEGDEVITRIKDNAGRIDETIIDKIFDPYFSTKDEKTGTGLGLYMSKTIVEKHLSGMIKVENIDGGVNFIISLPRQEISDE